MTRPLIGIGADVAQGDPRDRAFVFFTYIDAIVRAGGAAFIIPPQDDLDAVIDVLDGVLLAGGADSDPLLYGEERHPSVKVMDPRRQANEMALASLARARGVPLLGICLGMQVMNIAAGGKLVQDIKSYFDDALQHESDINGRARHEIKVNPDSKLAIVIGAGTHDVNSTHHQAVRITGEHLVATAHATDGIIEALEDQRHPFYVGVQWHPEDMTGEAGATKLFEAFVASSKERSRRRK